MKAGTILSDKKLSITSGRKHILELLIKSNVALTEKEIRSMVEYRLDRATVYRTLKIFTEKGIIHPIITENLATKYVLRKEPENHLHFKCTSCEQVFCMPAVQFSAFSLPPGFIQYESSFIVTGKCKACNI